MGTDMRTRSSWALWLLASVALPCVIAGCSDDPFTEPYVLAEGKAIEPDLLNRGHEEYMRYCFACHGEAGNGRGPASPGFRPPPRDFREATFKFGGVEPGELPHDEDLERIIKRGLDGTPMLPWDITDGQRHAIIQYIKTLSPRWQEDELGERTEIAPDPWKGKVAEAVQRGKSLYHVTAQCASCHPYYVTRDEVLAMAKAARPDGDPPEFRDDMYGSPLKDSDFNVKILPIDFLFHRVKAGTSLEDLYLTIGSGIGGTAMPMWKGSLLEEDLWAIVYYTKSLADMRDTPAAAALRKTLADQPPMEASVPAP